MDIKTRELTGRVFWILKRGKIIKRRYLLIIIIIIKKNKNHNNNDDDVDVDGDDDDMFGAVILIEPRRDCETNVFTFGVCMRVCVRSHITH